MWTERLCEVTRKKWKREFTFCCPVCRGRDSRACKTIPPERLGLQGFDDESGFHVHLVEYLTTIPQETRESHEPKLPEEPDLRPPKTRKPNIRTLERQARERLEKGQAAIVSDKLAARWKLPLSRRPRNRPPTNENFKLEARRARAEILPWTERIERVVRSFKRKVSFLDEADRQFKEIAEDPSWDKRHLLPCERDIYEAVLFPAIDEALFVHRPSGWTKLPRPPSLRGWSLLWMVREWLMARLEMKRDPELGDDTRPNESVTDIILRQLYDKRRFPWMHIKGEPVWGLDPTKKQPLRALLRPVPAPKK